MDSSPGTKVVESWLVKSSQGILWAVEGFHPNYEVLDSAGLQPYDDLNDEIIQTRTSDLLYDQNSTNDDDLLSHICPAHFFLVLDHNVLGN